MREAYIGSRMSSYGRADSITTLVLVSSPGGVRNAAEYSGWHRIVVRYRLDREPRLVPVLASLTLAT